MELENFYWIGFLLCASFEVSSLTASVLKSLAYNSNYKKLGLRIHPFRGTIISYKKRSTLRNIFSLISHLLISFVCCFFSWIAVAFSVIGIVDRFLTTTEREKIFNQYMRLGHANFNRFVALKLARERAYLDTSDESINKELSEINSYLDAAA